MPMQNLNYRINNNLMRQMNEKRTIQPICFGRSLPKTVQNFDQNHPFCQIFLPFASYIYNGSNNNVYIYIYTCTYFKDSDPTFHTSTTA